MEAIYNWTIPAQRRPSLKLSTTMVRLSGRTREATARSHGFIYFQGSWATLNYLNAGGYTELLGIRNAGVILGNPQGGPFIYEGDQFKSVYYQTPGDTVSRGMSANGMITGEVQLSDGAHGFTAVCQ
jgi:hypothetical protein